jgi:hypothetical protein
MAVLPNCVCCGSELTAPVYIKGNVYGYSCAAKIEGGKEYRKKKLVPCEIVKDFKNASGWIFATVVKTDSGEKIRLNRDNAGNLVGAVKIDDSLFVNVTR